jgi:hypothetical protein
LSVFVRSPMWYSTSAVTCAFAKSVIIAHAVTTSAQYVIHAIPWPSRWLIEHLKMRTLDLVAKRRKRKRLRVLQLKL